MHFSDLARCNLRYWHIMSSDAYLDDSKCLPKHSRAFLNLEWSSRESKGLLIIFQDLQGPTQSLPGPSRIVKGFPGTPRATMSFRAYQGLHDHVHMNLPGLSKAIQDLQEYSRAFKSNTLPGISRARGDKFIFI